MDRPEVHCEILSILGKRAVQMGNMVHTTSSHIGTLTVLLSEDLVVDSHREMVEEEK